MLDAGCGSGVLAVAAVRLGFEPVHAVDLDPVAVDVARATARSNRVHVDVFRADVVTDELPGVDVVAANIELRVVELLLGRLRAGIVVTSGYPAGVEPSAQGWDVLSRAELDGWGAHVFGAA